MKETNLRSRLGFIRVGNITWEQYGDRIKRNIGERRIYNVLPSLGEGRYMAAVDVIFELPEFEELEAGAPYPQYAFDLDDLLSEPIKFSKLRKVESS
jgi:hypothetical protein